MCEIVMALNYPEARNLSPLVNYLNNLTSARQRTMRTDVTVTYVNGSQQTFPA
jgi:hypothetical protein